MSFEAISNRVTGNNNVSVGTTLAMETILPNWPVFDPARVKPPAEDIRNYKKLMINIATLGRNFYNAVPREYRNNLLGDIAGQAVCEEAMEIYRAIKEYTSGTVEVGFYLCSYDGLAVSFPKGKIRQAVTDKQKEADKEVSRMIKFAAEAIERELKGSVEHFNVDIKPKTVGNILLMTHFPVDLLSEYRMGRCTLLESHTGVIKRKNLWYTKLFHGKQFPMIPFNAMTLQVFGDDHHFHPWSITIKNILVDLATKNRWSWATSSSKIRLDMIQIPDKIIVDSIGKLL